MTTIEELAEAASHWKASYEIEAAKREEEKKFLSNYFPREWDEAMRALTAHMMCIEL